MKEFQIPFGKILFPQNSVDIRKLRVFSDTLSASHNIATLLFDLQKFPNNKLGEDLLAKCSSFDVFALWYNTLTTELRDEVKVAWDSCVLVTSYTSPLLEILREDDCWRAYELAWIGALCKGESETQLHRLGKRTPLTALKISLSSLGCEDIHLVLGPVWKPLNKSALQNGLQKKLIDELASYLIGKLSDERNHAVGQLSKSRILRMISHRSAISNDDFLDRAQSIKELFSQIAEKPITPKAHSIDIENYTLEILFSIVANIPLTEVGSSNCAAKSKFEDEFITHRNGYFLERLMLFRLSLQDGLHGDPDSAPFKRVLDHLCRKIHRIFGADACNLYRYISHKRKLVRIASHTDPFARNEFDERAAKAIEDVGSNDSDRAKSACYRCVDSLHDQHYPDAGAEDLYLVPGEVQPKSVYVFPLVVRGRIWGVLELTGENAHQFLPPSLRWIEEIARQIAPMLYDRWSVKQLEALSRSSLSLSHDKTALDLDKASTFAQNIAELFLADSATVYLQTPEFDTFYDPVFSIGRSFAQLSDADKRIDLRDKKSVSAAKIGLATNQKAQLDFWTLGRIGSAPFDEEWLSKNKNHLLQVDRHTEIAIIPIVDQNAFASITLTWRTSPTGGGFSLDFISERWSRSGNAIRDHLAVLLRSVQNQRLKKAADLRFHAHTVKVRIKRLESVLHVLKNNLLPLVNGPDGADAVSRYLNAVNISEAASKTTIGSNYPAFRFVERLLRSAFPSSEIRASSRATGITLGLSDLARTMKDLEISVVALAGGENIESPFSMSPQHFVGPSANLYEILKMSAATASRFSKKAIPQIPTDVELPRSVFIKMPSPVLSDVLGNVFDNAFKYDHQADYNRVSSVRIQSTYNVSDQSITLRVRNIAPMPHDDVRMQLGRIATVRDPYAVARSSDGTGLGIVFCKSIAEKWGFQFDYNLSSELGVLSKTGEKLVWHEVQIVFNGGCTEIDEEDYGAS
jgi:GAF domain